MRDALKAKYAALLVVVSVLISTVLVYAFIVWNSESAKADTLSVFVGVDAAYDNPEEIKILVDAISPYTNLFIIGSTGITHNETKLNDMCQYIYNKGLSFIVYTEMAPQIGTEWIEHAKASWGDRFLGLYVHDEPGGKQVDLFTMENGSKRYPVKQAENYTDARNQFVATINMTNQWMVGNFSYVDDIQIFTSDYAVYWFDYLGGYDTLFAEFGWNYSRQLNIALCRGAAVAQNKDWGVMITHTYTEPPYLEYGDKIFEDMVQAYENGAKYIVIFDTNKNYTHGTLTEGHILALKKFTEYAHKYPRTSEPTSERAAFVLPKDFAYGFRGPTDKIWGLWEADNFSYSMSVHLGSLLRQYDNKLDVIYDDEVDYYRLGYGTFIFWNATIIGG